MKTLYTVLLQVYEMEKYEPDIYTAFVGVFSSKARAHKEGARAARLHGEELPDYDVHYDVYTSGLDESAW